MSVSVLFVCLGNICRSPLAEAAFREVARRDGFPALVDSAGTGNWHAGQAPDHRAQAVALDNGIDISAFRARQIEKVDFGRFDHIIALDDNNLAELKTLRGGRSKARLSLLLDHVPGRKGHGVKDPYYGDAEGFRATWDDVWMASEALLASLKSGTI